MIRGFIIVTAAVIIHRIVCMGSFSLCQIVNYARGTEITEMRNLWQTHIANRNRKDLHALGRRLGVTYHITMRR